MRTVDVAFAFRRKVDVVVIGAGAAGVAAARALHDAGVSYPMRTPVIVGCRGGPDARHLSLVEGFWTHDWEHDPFARGAYSYGAVGGTGAPAALVRPLRRTLFFAGEAVETEGGTGTVDGAISSGRRAAKQVLRVLG